MNRVAADHPCPACDGREFRRVFVVRGTPIYRCTDCGLGTVDWPAFDPAEFYDASYWQSGDVRKGYADYFSLAEATARTHRQRLAWIRRHLAGEGEAPAEPRLSRSFALPPRLLDAGCGPGFFVQAAGEAGFAAVGVEVSEFAVDFARGRLGQYVWQGQIRADDLGDGPYDVVTLWDVLEHLPDPTDALAAVAGVMPVGGLLAISTGDWSSLVARLSGPRWHLFNLPEHLWFFTQGSLRRVLRRAGFEPLDCCYEVCWYTFRYLVERLEAMVAGGRPISPRLGALGRLAVPVTLADVVTMLARKRAGDVHRPR